MFNWLFKRDHCPEEEEGGGVDRLVLDAHARCIRNREALQRVDRCGCFYCNSIVDVVSKRSLRPCFMDRRNP